MRLPRACSPENLASLRLDSLFDYVQVCTASPAHKAPVTPCRTYESPIGRLVLQLTRRRVPRSCSHVCLCTEKQPRICLRHSDVALAQPPPLPPLSSFRHGACYRVIALLINVSPSRDNSVIFTVRFFRLAMRDIQWCNLLSVYYALRRTPVGTVWSGARQDTHLSMDPVFWFFLTSFLTENPWAKSTKIPLQITKYLWHAHSVKWWNGGASF